MNRPAAYMLLGAMFGPLGFVLAVVAPNEVKPLPVDKTIIAEGVPITRGDGSAEA